MRNSRDDHDSSFLLKIMSTYIACLSLPYDVIPPKFTGEPVYFAPAGGRGSHGAAIWPEPDPGGGTRPAIIAVRCGTCLP